MQIRCASLLLKTIFWALLINLVLAPVLNAQKVSKRQRQNTRQLDLTPRQIAQKALSSVVSILVENEDRQIVTLGSGFFTEDDLIVTNHHVIKEANDISQIYIKLVSQNGLYKIKEVCGVDEDKDIAVLRIAEIKVQPLTINGKQQVVVGDVIYCIGSPNALEGTFSQGLVSGIRKVNGIEYIQVTAPMWHGSSGGPILNKRGEVIGIAIGGIEKGQNLNFAISVSYLLGPEMECSVQRNQK